MSPPPADGPTAGCDGPESRPAGAGEYTRDPSADARDDAPVRLDGVSKRYEGGGGSVVALDDVEFRVDRGEVVAVVGPSGSGKSTMLNLLGLLDAPTEGRVLLRGRPTAGLSDRATTDVRRETIGFVFQDFHLLPTLSAVENVALPTTFLPDDATARAEELLERVGLGERLDHVPGELSGGQKQRVAIARSLVNRPDVVLADEPTGNLDRDTARDVLAEFRRVADGGVGVVAVTHDDLVTEYADRTVELVDGVVRRE
ncbi:ABC transporter ATP-binding protein [Candidatus Halobonum tyrrellensis]|uniref:Phosphonate-transporting ATPase n=1 Tax=Candidatus Halobonum tyrrellensis G22 TaxID=1324957 RepID=V4IVP1_9EURY|nr:ABC transporter ATP-binding protein [Candidatus Halobonum tyrrellensis]ESP87267.1 phosphonate-transporting ATPase [Candidatus Halobonum tyrrellensis G22]